ncbi:hypothetical protein [Halobacillus amylolyticus]|uniref:Uncharacterized protein n=1 Tax=Halobacillus amylolyticus TaxID=2932259 RepID=A0ABY4H989_9BACI|nr:hypothetical protein [Halobacillus amylolyticus]UOR10848.1 hypothetical protein MUO15_14635 [Halobacillus amylolyticus]
MRHRHLSMIILCAILFLNITFMQLTVHQYFYENYVAALVYTAINLILFPIALIIYKRDKNKGGSHPYEK